jgi:hypothetical protein
MHDASSHLHRSGTHDADTGTVSFSGSLVKAAIIMLRSIVSTRRTFTGEAYRYNTGISKVSLIDVQIGHSEFTMLLQLLVGRNDGRVKYQSMT